MSGAVWVRPTLRVDGVVRPELAQDLLQLDVHRDEAALDSCEILLRAEGPGGTSLRYQDGKILGLGRILEVAVGDHGAQVIVFKGPITALSFRFPADQQAELLINAEDDAFALRLGQHSRVHNDQADDAAMQHIAKERDLRAEVHASGPSYFQLSQLNGTDLGWLRERARALDARLAIADGQLRVQKRGPASAPPTVLQRSIDLLWVEVGADLAHQRREVQVHGWDVRAGKALHGKAEKAAIREEYSSGTSAAEILEKMNMAATEHHSLEQPGTEEEARGLAASLFRARARSFVIARGATAGHPHLKPGEDVDLRNLGDWFSGRYRLRAVQQRFDMDDGFRTHFVATRATLGGAT